MDARRVLERARSILLSPRTEWPVVAAEDATVREIFQPYVLALAALPAVAEFLRWTVFGLSMPFSGRIRIGLGAGLRAAVSAWVLSVAGTYLLGRIVEALAPSFGGRSDRVQAMKTAAYSMTAIWFAGVANAFPCLGLPVLLAGAIYGLVLLRGGLAVTMRCPQDRATGYAIAVGSLAAVLWWLTGSIGRNALDGFPMPEHGAGDERQSRAEAPAVPAPAVAGLPPTTAPGMTSTAGSPAPPAGAGGGSPGSGGGTGLASRIEEAARRIEEAGRSGDPAAQRDAIGQAIGSILGGGARVEALSPERLRGFVPVAIGPLRRTGLEVERNGALGFQVSTARSSYADGKGHRLELEITDLGSVRGLVGLAEWASILHESETEDGWDRTRKVDGRIVHEKWDAPSGSGEYGVVLGERFSVRVSGPVGDVSVFNDALHAIDLAGLEALRNEGVAR